MATGKRTRRDRREEIHRAAVEVFCAKGFAAATMQDVAEAVGILKGSLYHYVSSKDDLLKAVFLDAVTETDERLAALGAADLDPAGRLRAFIEGQVRWYLEHLDHGTVLLREWRYVRGHQRRAVARFRRTYEDFLRGLLEDCVAAGVTRPGLDVDHALNFVLGAVDATPQWYRATGADDPQRIARIYADLTLGAVLPAP